MAMTTLPAIGMNLNGYSYYQTAHPFTDVGTQVGFGPYSGGSFFATTGGVTLDSSGNVIALAPNCTARKVVFTHNGGIYPTGDYRLEWQGSGDINVMYYGSTPFTVTSSGTNFKIVNVPTNANTNGLNIEVASVNPSNPPHHIKLIAPFSGYVSGDVFSRPFLNSLTGYGVIRFMDWNDTNFNSHMYWSDRITPNHSSWEDNNGFAGVPYEKQIELVNKLNTNAWINVPHLADNDYVTQLATLVNNNLNSGSRVWVEYSNEVWNFQFTQASYAYTGLTQIYGLPDKSQAYGRRAGEIINIFKSICGTGGRVIGVIAGQAVNPSILTNALQGAVISGKQVGDVCAIAPYFSVDLNALFNSYTGGMSQPNLLNFAFTMLSGQIAATGLGIACITSHNTVANSHGLPLVCYEGGLDLTPAGTPAQYSDPGFIDLLHNIHRDPRMSGTYNTYLSNIHGAGNYTLNQYSDCYPTGAARFGQWGLTEHYLDVTAPKYIGLRSYVDNRRTSGTFNINVTVPPIINNLTDAIVIENNTNVFTLSSYGLEPMTISIVSGNDQNKFTINNTTRLVSFTGAPDYENPTDSNIDNIYNVTIRVTNVNGVSVNKNFNINVYNSLSEPGSIPLTSGLIRRWKFNDNNSTSIITESLNGFNAFYTTGQQTQNRTVPGPNSVINKGLLFNADTDWARISGISFSSNQPLTFAGWVSGAEPQSFGNSGNFAGGLVNAGHNGDNTVQWANGFSVIIVGMGPTFISYPNWTFTVITKDSGNIGRAYLNGVANTSGAFDAGADIWNPGALHYTNTTVNARTAAYADFGIWNRVLTPSEILTLYNSGSGFAYHWTPCLIKSNSGFSVIENNSTIGTVTTTGVTPIFSIFGGNDANKVTISTGGILNFLSPPNYEIPTDSNLDNIYEFTVQVANAAGPVLQDIRVNILNNVSDDPIAPTIINNQNISISTNSTFVTNVLVNGTAPFTYQINGGEDQALFSIDESTGLLSFINPANYDSPLDFNSDNIYKVRIIVSNSVGNDVISFNISIINSASNANQTSIFYININNPVYYSNITVFNNALPVNVNSIEIVDITKDHKFVNRFHHNIPPSTG